MPSLSTSLDTVATLPASSATVTSNTSTPPAEGDVTGTLALHVPDWKVPAILMAAIPFTVTALAPTASVVTTVTPTVLFTPTNTSSVRGAVTDTSDAVVSCTMTLKVRVAPLLRLSVAEHDSTVVPNGNTVPDAASHDTATTPSTASSA